MKHRALAAAAAVTLAASLGGASVAGAGESGDRQATQTAPVNWHPQSGNTGAVGEGATATLVRNKNGIHYRFDTSGMNPGNAYSVWLVVVNSPELCNPKPCTPPQILGDANVNGQVTWGKDGQVGRSDGTARFRANFRAGPLVGGWLPEEGLDDPMRAEIHLVINDHGPVIPGLRHEMLSTYRAGCSDDSPFPGIFPATALADGTPGPNTCLLWQSAVFTPPDNP